MTFRRSLLLVLLVSACKPAPAPQKPNAAAVPTMRATVITVRTTIQPGNRTLTHTIAIANGRARSGNEVDTWRLFDVDKQRVTYVDDLAHTYRIAELASLLRDRKKALADDMPDYLPRATIEATGATRKLQGIDAKEYLIRMGAYERHLWIAPHSAIPPQLFSMMQASEEIASPLAATTRTADEVLTNVRGFPLADHAELTAGNKKMVVDREVVSIEQRDVPADWLSVRGDHKRVE